VEAYAKFDVVGIAVKAFFRCPADYLILVFLSAVYD